MPSILIRAIQIPATIWKVGVIMSMSLSLLKFEGKIRDPIYRYIPFTSLEKDVIDTKVVQRLRRISQTFATKFVYPGAEHSRFSHSLGVMHLAGMLAESLLFKKEFNDEFHLTEKIQSLTDRGRSSFPELKDLSDNLLSIAKKVQTVRLAGLLHDVGHAPFSHTLEQILEEYLGLNHEEMGIRILNENGELREAIQGSEIAESLDIDIQDIIDVLKRETEDKFLGEILSGTFDVDKIDYFVRDAYYAGTIEYGYVDAERLIDTLTVHSGTLIPDSSVIETIIEFWEARFHMFSAVYYHRAVRAIDLVLYHMINSFLSVYKDLKDEERPKTLLSAFLHAKNIDDYLTLDDYTTISELIRLKREGWDFRATFKFLDMYLQRKLLTCVDEVELIGEKEEIYRGLTRYLRIEMHEIADLAGIPEEEIFIDTPGRVGIKVNPVFAHIENIQIFDKKENKIKTLKDYECVPIKALSSYRGLKRTYTFEEYEEKVKTAIKEIKEIKERKRLTSYTLLQSD